MYKILSFLFLVFFSTGGWSQSDSLRKEPNSHDSLRSLYIKRYPDHFSLWAVIKSRSLGFDARNIKTNDAIRYRPNSRTSLGVGLYLFEVLAEITFSVPEEPSSVEKFGSTRVRDVQLNAIGKFWGADAYWQRYNGFYLDNSAAAVNGIFPQRADIKATNFGMSGFYVFNRQKFSLRSAYNFSEHQLKRGGSWMVIGTVNSFRISGDSSFFESTDPSSELVSMRYTTLGLAPGYSYSYVYQNFFFNGTVGFGPAHNWMFIRHPDGKEVNSVSINSYSLVRLGIGYNSDRFFGGLGFSVQSRNLRIEDVRYSNSTSVFKVLFGYRFREFGFLKKRAVDLLR